MGEDQTSNDMIQLIESESLVIRNFSCVCWGASGEGNRCGGIWQFCVKTQNPYRLLGERASVPICGRAQGLGPFTRSVVEQMGPG